MISDYPNKAHMNNKQDEYYFMILCYSIKNLVDVF